jgi:uncharacterized SAM-binding protein YcdF (DUF218 family)
MGFTLKKILSAVLMPLSLGLILFLIGLWFLYTKSYKKAKICLSISFIWILETTYQKVEDNVSAKYILLLGGDFKGRSFEAIRLYTLLDNAKIITSGYPGRDDVSEAVKSARKLVELGIPKEDIIMQSEPKDTQEEAQHIRKIVGDEQFILVTAAYHMPRAMELFKKEGLNPITAPTNYLVEKNYLLSAPSGRNLQKTEIAFHEYLGKTWNKLKEYKNYFLNKSEE